MSEEEVAVKLNALEHETKSLKHRVDNLETMSKEFNKLLTQIEKINTNIEHIIHEQSRQSAKLEKLENEPINNAKEFKKIVLTVVVTVVLGGVLGFIMGKVGF